MKFGRERRSPRFGERGSEREREREYLLVYDLAVKLGDAKCLGERN
jgi:hypothetical protein